MCGVAFTQDNRRSDTNTPDMRPCYSVCLQGTSGHAGVGCSSTQFQLSSLYKVHVVLALLALQKIYRIIPNSFSQLLPKDGDSKGSDFKICIINIP